MAKNLYIIDGHAHIYASYFAPMSQRLSSPSGEPTKATYIFTSAILRLIEDKKPDMLVVAMDAKEPSFRVKMYADYKAHRPPMPDDMPIQINRIEQILEAMRIPMLRVGGFEADDLIGTLAKKASVDGIDVFICSKDKDMLQLLDKHISIYDLKSGEITDTERLMADKKLRPEQFIDVLALQGDTSDNIPGVKDVGPKTAIEWIQKYGSIDNLLKNADEITGKRGENLRSSKDIISLSRKLVVIDCEAPVNIDYDNFAVKEYDKERLTEIFNELGFSRLLTQMHLTDVSEKTPAEEKSPKPKTTDKADYQLIDSPEKYGKFLEELKKQNLFAVDTETTSVEPMRADLVGLSFCFSSQKAYYLPIKTPLGTSHLAIAEVRKTIGPVLADAKIKKIGQNLKYDILVLRNAGMPLKGIYFDTMVASYCLDPMRKSHSLDNMALDFLNYQCVPISSLIGKGKNQLTFDMVDTESACRYSAEDADITFRLYEYLKERLDRQPEIKKLFEEVEMPLVEVLVQMEFNGVSLDTNLLRKMSGRLDEEIKKFSEKIYAESGSVFNIDSPKQLAEILFDRLGLAPIRIGKEGRSTDAAVLEELSEQHKIADMILQYRQLSKLRNTYVDKLGALINPRTGRVHASFNQTVTATGRLSSSGPNLQNIPIRTELGKQIRAAFIPASKTDCILSADYSQIELRLLAHFSGDEALRKAFAEDRDIHRFVASQIFGVPIEKVTDDMRSRCKAVNFGIIYGQGAFGLSRTIGISQAEARRFIDDYFARYNSIKAFMEEVVNKAKKDGFAETILNRRRTILDLNSKNANKRNQAERLAVNTTIQGSAADLIKVAMINIQRKIENEKLPVKLILQIHDELVFELPSEQVNKHSPWISEEMTKAINLSVPLKVDITYGPNWLG